MSEAQRAQFQGWAGELAGAGDPAELERIARRIANDLEHAPAPADAALARLALSQALCGALAADAALGEPEKRRRLVAAGLALRIPEREEAAASGLGARDAIEEIRVLLRSVEASPGARMDAEVLVEGMTRAVSAAAELPEAAGERIALGVALPGGVSAADCRDLELDLRLAGPGSLRVLLEAVELRSRDGARLYQAFSAEAPIALGAQRSTLPLPLRQAICP